MEENSSRKALTSFGDAVVISPTVLGRGVQYANLGWAANFDASASTHVLRAHSAIAFFSAACSMSGQLIPLMGSMKYGLK